MPKPPISPTDHVVALATQRVRRSARSCGPMSASLFQAMARSGPTSGSAGTNSSVRAIGPVGGHSVAALLRDPAALPK